MVLRFWRMRRRTCGDRFASDRRYKDAAIDSGWNVSRSEPCTQKIGQALYYRQETINARSGVRTPRTTLAAWAGAAGAELESLGQAHKAFVLG